MKNRLKKIIGTGLLTLGIIGTSIGLDNWNYSSQEVKRSYTEKVKHAELLEDNLRCINRSLGGSLSSQNSVESNLVLSKAYIDIGDDYLDLLKDQSVRSSIEQYRENCSYAIRIGMITGAGLSSLLCGSLLLFNGCIHNKEYKR